MVNSIKTASNKSETFKFGKFGHVIRKCSIDSQNLKGPKRMYKKYSLGDCGSAGRAAHPITQTGSLNPCSSPFSCFFPCVFGARHFANIAWSDDSDECE